MDFTYINECVCIRARGMSEWKVEKELERMMNRERWGGEKVRKNDVCIERGES